MTKLVGATQEIIITDELCLCLIVTLSKEKLRQRTI